MAPSKPDRTQYHALAVNEKPSTSPRRAPSSPAAALDRANSVIGDYEIVFDATAHGDALDDSGSTGSELELGSPRLEAFGITDAVGQAKSSVVGAALNFTNSIIGAGIIGLPYAFRQAGFFLGVALLIGLTVLVDWTVVLLVKAGKVSGKSSYQSLVDSVVGKRGSFLVAMFQFVFAFGAMCAYTVIVGDTLPTVLKALVPSIANAPLLSREWIMVLTTLFISFPLSMQRDMAALAKTSAVSMAAIVLIVSLIILRCLHLPESLLGDPKARFTWIGDSPIKAIGVISFAFVCHHNTFIIYGSLDLPTLDRFARVTHLSAATSLIACLLLAVSAYLAFTTTTQGNVLNNFAPDDTVINIARLAFALNMFTTFPMETFVARHVLDDYFFAHAAASNVRHWVWTVALVVLSLIVAVSVHDVSVVLEVTGGVSASALAFILPAWCWLRLASSQRWKCIACMAFGVVVMVLSVAM
ncbi:hypothetical protein GGF32_004306 [Allomyces javanicus]|nr:hypothetical protein GGF32_004306 [Allomyces javanicus]